MKIPAKFEHLAYLVISLACFLSFLYGSLGSWRKYLSEPVSPITTEEEYDFTTLPSVTVCRYLMAKAHQYPIEDLEDIRVERGFDISFISVGYRRKN